MVNIAVNGLGRIGRAFIRAFYEFGINKSNDIKLVAINGTTDDAEKCAHFLKYDSVHGRFANEVIAYDGYITIDGEKIFLTKQTDINTINWRDLNADVIIECSGRFNKHSEAYKHICIGGAKKVLVSAPCDEGDRTIIYGVNDNDLRKSDEIVSAGSCTTNALLPLIQLIHNKCGIRSGFFTTIHAYTNDQVILDANHKDLRRGRAAGLSMIPTSTGASKLIAGIFPELNGLISGSSVRVPVPNVSMIDLKLNINEVISSSDELHKILSSNINKCIIDYTQEALVSTDFNHTSASTTIDGLESMMITPNFIRIVSWYDNEWGFTCRLIDILQKIISLGL